jgi:hypothetical protein
LRKLLIRLLVLIVGAGAVLPLHAETIVLWRDVATTELVNLKDDDLVRHSVDPLYLDGLTVSEARFSEAGFDWHLLRFSNFNKPLGPLWVIPHDDENAAFASAIVALKTHGGVAVVVNSGPGSSRMQQGKGTCGGRPAIVFRCDPNRNFSAATPLFTAAHLNQRPAGQPIIALHTNSPGFGGAKGEITILEAASASRGKIRPRKHGFFGGDGPAVLKNHDSYAILPFVAPTIQDYDIRCRKGLVNAGVHVWHEPVSKSDGSLSNYVVLEKADAVYVNMESRREADLALASDRHQLMIAAYLSGCRI